LHLQSKKRTRDSTDSPVVECGSAPKSATQRADENTRLAVLLVRATKEIKMLQSRLKALGDAGSATSSAAHM
jgi:hypothetical protein